ncbi:MAG: gamma-glutamyltransferase [Deltaproteobacteria bacterium]|nr:gamma-glutamyltransferase [Deltaproteobacteria bacterium]
MRITRKTALFLLALAPLASPSPGALAAAVATSHELATKAAMDTLKSGGSAVDAVVTASFVLNVVQPYKMGIGGGGLLLASQNGKLHLWDHREAAPASASGKMLLDKDGKPLPRYPDAVTGPNPVGIPGTAAGLFAAHKKLGKLPWKRLLAPAIRIAREGFPITQLFEEELEENWERMKAFPATAALFGDGEGGHLKRGRVLRQPLLAKTLERIASMGAAEFYTGELARTWTAEARKLGVKITTDDLKAYKVRESKPVTYEVFGLRAATAAPPSTGGVLLAGAIRYLDRYYAQPGRAHELAAADSAKRIIVTAETLRYFQSLRDDLVADPPYGKLDPQKFLGSNDERAAWKEIDALIAKRLDKIETAVVRSSGAIRTVARAARVGGHTAPLFGAAQAARVGGHTAPLFGAAQAARVGGHTAPLFGAAQAARVGHTAHLSVIDDRGLSVAYTTTIEEIFGSGITVPGHGFLLNNELSDFDSEPGRPNSPAPGKRPRSNMSPTLLFSDSRAGANAAGPRAGIPVGVIGAAGGSRIPTTLAEILENYHLHKMNAREAIAFPRFHPRKEKLEVEKGFPAKTLQQLKEAGYEIEIVPNLWSVAQILLRRNTTAEWEAASEPRYDGLALTR